MLRFLLKLVGLVFMGVAVAAATVDGARSIAASDVLISSASETWTRLHPESLALAEGAVAGGPGALAFAAIVSLPTALVALVLGALFVLLGTPAQRRDLLEDPL